MIICSNCGTTNNETSGHICRKCGALLPISSKPPRIKASSKKGENQPVKEQRAPPEKKSQTATPQKALQKQKAVAKPEILDLHEIPKPKDENVKKYLEDDIETEFSEPEDDSNGEFLREITPQPFRGSIIADKGVYGHPQQVKVSMNSKSNNSQSSPNSSTKVESGILKQKQLEDDMTKVLSFLSKKITVKPLKTVQKVEKVKKKPEEVIPPSSMNEILKDLLKLDLYIEASAIIKKDGTILASAISSRISDSLFATIGQNLSMIGSDIIEGLSAGNLLNISIRGSNGVLDLAPIGSKETLGDEMILIILSHPRVKSGIIHFAVSMVKKQVSQYLGLTK
jgi:predicted regulator of Ras-like GTPase activity (Roadblock/LC7/MglB family)